MADNTSGADRDGRAGEQNEPSGGHEGSGAADETRVTRRRLVAAGAATWATASVSGCQYITDPGTGDDETETATATVTTETTTTGEPVGAATPTPTPSDGTDDPAPTPDGETDSPTDTPTATPTQTPPATTTSCGSLRRFAAGMEVGLHVAVYDPETGEPLGADAVNGVVVEFPDAEYGPLELNWEGDHEAYSTDTWGSKIVTDADTEQGTYRYEVTVDAENETVATTVTDRFTVV